MLFGVGLARVLFVLHCVTCVPPRSVGVMRGLLVLSAFVVFCSFGMMTGGVPVML